MPQLLQLDCQRPTLEYVQVLVQAKQKLFDMSQRTTLKQMLLNLDLRKVCKAGSQFLLEVQLA